MINICSNKLTIKGSAQSLNSFLDLNKGNTEEEPLILENSFRMPEHLHNNNVVEWKINHWGTINIDHFKTNNWFDRDAVERTILFKSPMLSPYKWLKKVSKRYPFIDFELTTWDESCDFFRIHGREYGNWYKQDLSLEYFEFINEALPHIIESRKETSKEKYLDLAIQRLEITIYANIMNFIIEVEGKEYLEKLIK